MHLRHMSGLARISLSRHNETMILTDIQQDIEKQIRGGRLRPRYEDYCIANIPSAAAYLLQSRPESPLRGVLERVGLEPSKKYRIVNFVIDGLGYRQLLRHLKGIPCLERLIEAGALTPLTSVFPSTTAAALTTLHTGLTPQQHGLPEWLVYFQEFQQVIFTLPFASLGDVGRDTLLVDGADPSVLFNGRTFYTTLAEAGVPSFTFTSSAYAQSAYSHIIHKGSEIVPFDDLPDAFAKLRRKLELSRGPAYFYLYWNGLDNVAHTSGPGSDLYVTALREYCELFESEFMQHDIGLSGSDIVFFITADHGQIFVDPEQTLYLSDYPEIVDSLRMNTRGQPIVPWGSARDVFLSIRPDKLESVRRFIMMTFGDRVAVEDVHQLLSEGYFGSGCEHPAFRSRLGDLLVLPKDYATVWYEHVSDQRFHLHGIHGGLDPEEMLVPLIVGTVRRLQS